MEISFQNLDPELQRKIADKPSKAFTILITCVASLFFPLVLMFAKVIIFENPKERIELVYDITQPREHPKGEVLTYIEVENTGQKEASDTIILEVEFRKELVNHEWKLPPDTLNILSEEILPPGLFYRLRFKNLGPGAKVAVLFKSTDDITKLPLLKYKEVVFPPRIKNTLLQYTP